MKSQEGKHSALKMSPGAKGWINKYFDFVQDGEISLYKKHPKNFEALQYQHLLLGKTGLIFGYPARLLYGRKIDTKKWTHEEKLKVLLFESLLFVFLEKNNITNAGELQASFTSKLAEFYSNQKSNSLLKKLVFFVKDSPLDALEDALTQRVDIKINWVENKWWVNSLHNTFVYLDVILFSEFLEDEHDLGLEKYEDYAYNGLIAIAQASNADNELQDKEKAMFSLFLASSSIRGELRDRIKAIFERGANFDDYTASAKESLRLKLYLMDLSSLTLFATEEAAFFERHHLKSMQQFLNVSDETWEANSTLVENFVLRNYDKIPFLSDKNAYEKVYSNLSTRWTKVLLRNKDKLAQELVESKDLVLLIKKSATTELTKEEKEQVKTQFMDIVKSMPALAIFMLPGGALLLPLVLKVLPDLIPTAFRDNEVDKES